MKKKLKKLLKQSQKTHPYIAHGDTAHALSNAAEVGKYLGGEAFNADGNSDELHEAVFLQAHAIAHLAELNAIQSAKLALPHMAKLEKMKRDY
jgi:hypothetical protein